MVTSNDASNARFFRPGRHPNTPVLLFFFCSNRATHGMLARYVRLATGVSTMGSRRSESVLTAVYASLRAVDLDPRDKAAAALAKRCAALVDDGELRAVAPLLSALRELRLTPRSRGTSSGGRTTGAPARARPIDELRAKRAGRSARQHGTAAVDSPAP
jgi:hypothetical protein